MKNFWIPFVVASIPTLLAAQTGRGPYARIAVLRPLDGHSVDFEAGYIRHLAWHQGARDPWSWYGWSIWAGDRNRWFIYATFSHSGYQPMGRIPFRGASPDSLPFLPFKTSQQNPINLQSGCPPQSLRCCT